MQRQHPHQVPATSRLSKEVTFDDSWSIRPGNDTYDEPSFACPLASPKQEFWGLTRRSRPPSSPDTERKIYSIPLLMPVRRGMQSGRSMASTSTLSIETVKPDSPKTITNARLSSLFASPVDDSQAQEYTESVAWRRTNSNHGHRPRLTYAEFAPHTRRYRRTLSPYTPRTPIREGIRAATVASARAACGGVRSECATAIALRACGAGQNAFLGPRAGWCGLRSAWRRSRSEPSCGWAVRNTGGGRFVNLWFVYERIDI